MSRFRYGPRLTATLVGLTLAVSACGGGSSGESASYSGGAPAPAADMQAPRLAEPSAAPVTAPGSDGVPEAGPGGAGQVKVVQQDRSIIYTAEMTVRARDVDAAAARARQLVTAAGGHLASENSDASSDGEGYATLVFKIPPGDYPGVLDRLGRDLGTRESLRQNTEDVTEEVADVESRLKSARAALDSLRALLKRAGTIGEVLKVEREIADRESELESLQARQKSLASRTSMATLTLNLVGPTAKVEKEDDGPPGFLAGVRAGWEGFLDAMAFGLTVAGLLVPWLIVVVPVWLLLVVLLRRRRRRAAARRAHPEGLLPAGPPREPSGEEPVTGRPTEDTEDTEDTKEDRSGGRSSAAD